MAHAKIVFSVYEQFLFSILMQYTHYDQITTELHPEYMHMTGN